INGEIKNIGIIAEFIIYVNMLTWPVAVIGWVTSIVQQAEVSQQRINEFLEEEPEIQNTVIEKTDIKGEITFKNVSFTYDDTNITALKNVSFNLEKGKTLAILGKTGSGKSTLMKLLVRILDYQEGDILIDSTSIKDIEKHYLRSNVGIILQEPFLFSKTVEENIGIADKEVQTDRVENVAKIAKVHDDIVNFEKGYKTLVGERGVTLSGGQKQRVAIARMLLKPKPILIFDDSLSAVDTETDIQIRRALKKEWKKSTVFIITHRITTAKEADKIIVLEDGNIKETGTHDELIKIDGLYNNIWKIQSRIDFQLGDGEENE
ncbi:MAG: ABC transporter ATP-binding protein, partial [Tenericutes bacterium]|nr:ABC transporter ATP-binding protein [Mycoplasmatota bacterium]